MVEGLFALFNSDFQLPVNLGNPKEYTILELSKLINDVVNNESGIVNKILPKDDPKMRRPDISLANKKLNWYPKVSLKQGLHHTTDWFKKEIGKT